MIYDDTHLFIALPSCASSFTQIFLTEGDGGWVWDSHSPLWSWGHKPYAVADSSIRQGREPFAAIRHPLKFYRSMYRYPRRWEETSWSGINEWAQLFLDGKPHLHYNLFQKMDLNLFGLLAQWDIGILTFNYLFQCAKSPRLFVAGKQAPGDVELAPKESSFLKVETIKEDLIRHLGLREEERKRLISSPPKNQSTEIPEPFTRETAELILHKERLICSRYGYDLGGLSSEIIEQPID